MHAGLPRMEIWLNLWIQGATVLTGIEIMRVTRYSIQTSARRIREVNRGRSTLQRYITIRPL